jgi:oxygen-independent coproporphyrinogen III oxidase
VTATDGVVGGLWTQMPMTGNNELSLYIHVPFCAKKCPYCHFYSIPCAEGLLGSFLTSLLTEISLRKEAIRASTIVSIYFGGGTPFLLYPRRLEKVLDALFQITPLNNIEITLEANPESVTKEVLLEYSRLGINRLSYGVQSFNIDELLLLGRRHTPDDAVNAIYSAIDVGISNISLDLMYEIPHHTHEAWVYSLDRACSLPITHLSLYNFMIEEPSAFFRKKDLLESSMPSPEVSEQMYMSLLEKTSAQKFFQYEISAFAKKGFSSKHNVGYWKGREFLGLGPSAFSFYEGKRFSNVANLHSYCTQLTKETFPLDFIDSVTPQERQKELLAVGLRMNEGVFLPAFQQKWGYFDESLLSTIAWLKKIHLLEEMESHLKLTTAGLLVYDRIASEII